MGTLFEAEVRTKNRINPEIIAGEYQVRYGYRILQLANDGVEIETKGHKAVIVKRPNFLPGDIFDIKLIDSGDGLFGSITGSMSINQHKRIIDTIDLVLSRIVEHVHEHHEDFPEIERNADFDELDYEKYTKLSQIVQDSMKGNTVSSEPVTKPSEEIKNEKRATKGQLIAVLSICGGLGLLTLGTSVLLGMTFLALAVIAGVGLGTGHYRS